MRSQYQQSEQSVFAITAFWTKFHFLRVVVFITFANFNLIFFVILSSPACTSFQNVQVAHTWRILASVFRAHSLHSTHCLEHWIVNCHFWTSSTSPYDPSDSTDSNHYLTRISSSSLLAWLCGYGKSSLDVEPSSSHPCNFKFLNYRWNGYQQLEWWSTNSKFYNKLQLICYQLNTSINW